MILLVRSRMEMLLCSSPSQVQIDEDPFFVSTGGGGRRAAWPSVLAHCDVQFAQRGVVGRYGERIGGLLWSRFTVHYTPKHGSWLNQAEIEISLFSRQCLGQRRIPSLAALRPEAQAWNRKVNRDRIIINWKFTRKRARQKFGYKQNKFILSET
jgi:hypothetical protein